MINSFLTPGLIKMASLVGSGERDYLLNNAAESARQRALGVQKLLNFYETGEGYEPFMDPHIASHFGVKAKDLNDPRTLNRIYKRFKGSPHKILQGLGQKGSTPAMSPTGTVWNPGGSALNSNYRDAILKRIENYAAQKSADNFANTASSSLDELGQYNSAGYKDVPSFNIEDLGLIGEQANPVTDTTMPRVGINSPVVNPVVNPVDKTNYTSRLNKTQKQINREKSAPVAASTRNLSSGPSIDITDFNKPYSLEDARAVVAQGLTGKPSAPTQNPSSDPVINIADFNKPYSLEDARAVVAQGLTGKPSIPAPTPASNPAAASSSLPNSALTGAGGANLSLKAPNIDIPEFNTTPKPAPVPSLPDSALTGAGGANVNLQAPTVDVPEVNPIPEPAVKSPLTLDNADSVAEVRNPLGTAENPVGTGIGHKHNQQAMPESSSEAIPQPKPTAVKAPRISTEQARELLAKGIVPTSIGGYSQMLGSDGTNARAQQELELMDKDPAYNPFANIKAKHVQKLNKMRLLDQYNPETIMAENQRVRQNQAKLDADRRSRMDAAEYYAGQGVQGARDYHNYMTRGGQLSQAGQQWRDNFDTAGWNQQKAQIAKPQQQQAQPQQTQWKSVLDGPRDPGEQAYMRSMAGYADTGSGAGSHAAGQAWAAKNNSQNGLSATAAGDTFPVSVAPPDNGTKHTSTTSKGTRIYTKPPVI